MFFAFVITLAKSVIANLGESPDVVKHGQGNPAEDVARLARKARFRSRSTPGDHDSIPNRYRSRRKKVHPTPETGPFAMRLPSSSLLLRPAALSAMLALVLLSVTVADGRARRTGDHLQIALPAAGLVCAATRGQAPLYAGRYLLLEAGIKLPKAALGQRPINRRPDGGSHGFPSGHTAAASFGASALVSSCLRDSPGAQAVAVLSAGFVGASRIDAGRHTIWQTLAGAVLGWLVATLKLAAFDRAVAAAWTRIGARLAVPGRLLPALRERTPVPGRP